MPPPPLRLCTAPSTVQSASPTGSKRLTGQTFLRRVMTSTLTKAPCPALPNGAAFAQGVTAWDAIAVPNDGGLRPRRCRRSSSASDCGRGRRRAPPGDSAERSTGLPDSSVIDCGLEHAGQRLVASHVGDESRQVAALDDLVGELLRRHLIARRLPDEVLGELAVADLHVGLVGERVQHELGPYRLLGALAQLGVELLARSCPASRGTGRTARRRDRASARPRARGTRPRPARPSRAPGTRPCRAASRAAGRAPGRPAPAPWRGPSRSRRSSRSSSMVSNSLASCANSSSTSGSSFSLTELTVALICACCAGVLALLIVLSGTWRSRPRPCR